MEHGDIVVFGLSMNVASCHAFSPPGQVWPKATISEYNALTNTVHGSCCCYASYTSFATKLGLQVFREVQQFLGVRELALSTNLAKIHTEAVKDSIDNFEAVAKELSGTSFEWMLTRETP